MTQDVATTEGDRTAWSDPLILKIGKVRSRVVAGVRTVSPAALLPGPPECPLMARLVGCPQALSSSQDINSYFLRPPHPQPGRKSRLGLQAHSWPLCGDLLAQDIRKPNATFHSIQSLVSAHKHAS